MNFVTAYDKTHQVRPVYEPEIDPETGEPITMTKQDQAAACDINNIVKKYQRTGLIDHLAEYAPHYGDATQVEYLDAFNLLQRTDTAFDSLPSSVRARFDNDPASWLLAIEGAETPEQVKAILEGESGQSSGVETASADEPPPDSGGSSESGSEAASGDAGTSGTG